jgi:predicted Zn-dependent protease
MAALILTLAASTASGADLAPRPPHLRPTDLSSEESGIWYTSEKAEAAARASGELDSDVELTAYVKSIECKVAPEYCDDLRVYVFDRPFMQALTAPNGYVEVWTGLLLRAHDEAEVAFVLGHETSHFAMNHSLQRQKELRRRMNEALVISLALAAGGAAAGYSSGSVQAMNNVMDATQQLVNVVYLGEMAGFFGFNREQESEADRLGFERLLAAHYDPMAGHDMWARLIEEARHSEFEKTRKRRATSGIFDTHPLDEDRMDALATSAKASGREGDGGQAALRAAIRPHLAAFIRDDLRRRDYGETLYILDQKLADGGDEGVLNYFRGECFRLRRGKDDGDQALAAYEKATAYADAPAETWREVGAIYQQRHDVAKSASAYRAYLDRAPTAQDRWLVDAILKKLDTLGAT